MAAAAAAAVVIVSASACANRGAPTSAAAQPLTARCARPHLPPRTRLLQGDDDVAYEEELTRNPYALKTWWQYIASKATAPAKVRRVGATGDDYDSAPL
jgi:hypothetical protein